MTRAVCRGKNIMDTIYRTPTTLLGMGLSGKRLLVGNGGVGDFAGRRRGFLGASSVMPFVLRARLGGHKYLFRGSKL